MVNSEVSRVSTEAMPVLYIPHGGGPCFFVDLGFGDTWEGLATWLKNLASTLPRKPKAMLIISAHWEEPEITVNSAPQPGLLYDYYGFPPESYEIKYGAPGSPQLAEEVLRLLTKANIRSRTNCQRGLDHGVFVPFKLIYPDADIPIVQLSLKRGLDPAYHLKLGEALAPLRKDGVLIVGSGMSYHNLRHFNKDGAKYSIAFDDWLSAAVCHNDPIKRWQLLTDWQIAPSAREAHPREEHLIPLLVAAGAAACEVGKRDYSERIMGLAISSFQFG